ncbi:MAG: GAF domain-containing protein [Nitrososphaerota archaeon]|nr:GAF domain-containing protein [Nitrososphaerota archaeon]
MKIFCKVLKEHIPYFFWIGFYFNRGSLLELGPSMGPPACAQIPLTGVCGRAVKTKKPIIVPDVDRFPGHIACDPRSRSEIAIPLLNERGEVVAVLDVDSDKVESFDEVDLKWLEMIIGEVFSSGDLDRIIDCRAKDV